MRSKKVIAALSAITMLGSLATAVPMSASAATTVTTYDKYSFHTKLQTTDFSVSYYKGTISKANQSDAQGNIITIGDKDSSKDTSVLFDGLTPSNQFYVGGPADANGYVLIDLGENHKKLSKIVTKNIYQQVVLGLTNTISNLAETINLDYSIRFNNTNPYNPSSKSISYYYGDRSGDVYTHYTLSGQGLGDYRYLILHCNGSNTYLDELELYFSDIDVGYYYGMVDNSSGSSVITVGTNNGTEVTGGDRDDIGRLTDGDTAKYISRAGNGDAQRYFIIDLGENHAEISKVKMYYVRHSMLIGWTNSVSKVANGTFTLDGTIRMNNNQKYGNTEGITQVSGNTVNNDYRDTYEISGDPLKNYRYFVLHSNGSEFAVADLELYTSSLITKYEVTTDSGITVDTSSGLSEGDTVNITSTPSNMVADSLRVHNTSVDNDSARVSIANNAFTMPASDVTVTCLVDNGTTTVLGSAQGNKYFARFDTDMKMDYVVNIPEGKRVASAALYIPYKTHNYNRSDMALKKGETVIKTLENSDRTLNQYDIQGVDVTSYVTKGTNTFIVTNNNANGVDYFSADTAPTAEKIPRLVLTFEDIPVVKSASIVQDYITYQTGKDGSTAAGFFAELTATGGTSIEKLGVKVDVTDRGSQYLSSDGKTHTTLTGGTAYIPVIVKNVTSANIITLYVE